MAVSYMLAVMEGELKFVDVQYHVSGLEQVKLHDEATLPESWRAMRDQIVALRFDAKQWDYRRFREHDIELLAR
jgi:hypothetical protein